MSMCCVMAHDHVLRFPFAVWVHVTSLAQRYGWEPAGTEPPDAWQPSDDAWTWHQGYLSNEGARVTAPDASALGIALRQALPDIPEHDAIPPERLLILPRGPVLGVRMSYDQGVYLGTEPLPAEQGDPDDVSDLVSEGNTALPVVTWAETEVGGLRHGPSLSSLVLLSGARRDHVAAFARQCQAGGFRIC